jgi:hypothetical protein
MGRCNQTDNGCTREMRRKRLAISGISCTKIRGGISFFMFNYRGSSVAILRTLEASGCFIPRGLHGQNLVRGVETAAPTPGVPGKPASGLLGSRSGGAGLRPWGGSTSQPERQPETDHSNCGTALVCRPQSAPSPRRFRRGSYKQRKSTLLLICSAFAIARRFLVISTRYVNITVDTS